MVKTAGLYLAPVKRYSKNGHPYLILKRILVQDYLEHFKDHLHMAIDGQSWFFIGIAHQESCPTYGTV